MIEHFENSNWSFLLWIVLGVTVVLFMLDRRGTHLLDRFLSTTMGNRLAHRISNTRRWTSIVCLGLSGLCLVVALMRPQWGISYVERERAGAQIMICLDVSKSMLAEDAVPNRLDRAKAELTDLLTLLDGDQVGLIAFAGRATVLCPMTSDFSFFRLILDGAGPHSVGRGGTKLEEPIRKALDGFRTGADVSRAILLITDGEDHDSHPTHAAEAAKERGIKILAVGFGDEAGSEIEFTDPVTGVRSKVLTDDGTPVITKLDGETLRKMAMTTDGAYIPAGTGLLDLQSIYDAHVAPLMRGEIDDRGHAVRNDAFQWFVLLGVLFFFAAIVVGSGNVRSEIIQSPLSTAKTARAATCFAALALGLTLVERSGAQTPDPPGDTAVRAEEPAADQTPQDSSARRSSATNEDTVDEEADPRSLFNESLALLETDADKAERLLTKVRRTAGTDGEARFRATYNLGWVEIQRADQLVKEKPKEALQHLRQAADWFRDAIRLRTENDDARHNLEVVMRRILELSDSLAQQDQQDLTKQLEAVIETQRGLVAQLRQLVQMLSTTDDPNAADQLRSEFRQLALEQRKNISASQSVSSMAREEVDSLTGKAEEQRTPEEQLRLNQLSNLLHYANQADQRLGQARSQMRRREADRAFRRAATGLTELKRARDQLREPVEILSVILADAMPLAQLTALVSSAENNLQVVDSPEASIEPPAWATLDHLQESQQAITQRTSELVTRLQYGLEQQENTGDESAEDTSAETKEFLGMLEQAMPYLKKGHQSFKEADGGFQSKDLARASEQQVSGIVALQGALERFMELKRLIDLAYTEEAQILQFLQPPPDETTDDSQATSDAAEQIQLRNLERAQRIGTMIESELAKLPTATPQEEAADPQQPPTAEQKQQDQETQRYTLAKQILGLAQQEMQSASELLSDDTPGRAVPDNANTTPPEPTTVENSQEQSGSDNDQVQPHSPLTHVTSAVDHLQSLRRLFYSIVEHLRETAQRQAELNDETEQLATNDTTELPSNLGPILSRQQELQFLAKQIASGLSEQARQAPPDNHGSPNDSDPQQQQLQQMAQQFTEATKLVAEGEAFMKSAVETMSQEKIELDPIRTHQDDALQKLAEALALLQPPQQQEQNQQEQQSEDQQQSESESESEQQQDQTAHPSQLLQAIRDEEARRRRERDKRQQQNQSIPVPKDW